MSEHGSRSAYVNDGCRCQPCTAANAVYWRARFKCLAQGKLLGRQLLNGRLTTIRIHSLLSEGYSQQQIATMAGVHEDTISRHMTSVIVSVRVSSNIRRVWQLQQIESES